MSNNKPKKCSHADVTSNVTAERNTGGRHNMEHFLAVGVLPDHWFHDTTFLAPKQTQRQRTWCMIIVPVDPVADKK